MGALHGAAQLLDSYLDCPSPCLVEPGEPEPTSYDNYAHVLGHAMMRGEIDATEAYRALSDYEDWVKAGEPKMTGLSTYFVYK